MARKLGWFTLCMIVLPVSTYFLVNAAVPPGHKYRMMLRCVLRTKAAFATRTLHAPAHARFCGGYPRLVTVVGAARAVVAQRVRGRAHGEHREHRVRRLGVPRTRARRRRRDVACDEAAQAGRPDRLRTPIGRHPIERVPGCEPRARQQPTTHFAAPL